MSTPQSTRTALLQRRAAAKGILAILDSLPPSDIGDNWIAYQERRITEAAHTILYTIEARLKAVEDTGTDCT